MTLSFDLEFDNWSPTGTEFLSIEYKTGTDVNWTALEEFSNSGDGFTWTNYSYNISNLSENLFVRFHCYGATTFDINWWIIDNFSLTSDGRQSRNEYDFIGYNVYVNESINNEAIFDSTNYTVYNLDNELEYVFSVSALYEGSNEDDNYESELIQVVAQPVYVFGDVTGTIVDPNGNATTGITRTSTTKNGWDYNTESNDMKQASTGGIDNWDPLRYLPGRLLRMDRV